MGVLQVIGGLMLLYFVYYYVYQLPLNYLKARRTGFKVYITPFNQTNPFWILGSPIILPFLKRFLPYSVWRAFDLNSYGYEWRDYVAGRTRPSAYVLCSPGPQLDIMLEDPELANIVLTKRRDFPQDPLSQKFLNVVGDNLLSSEGDDWSRQRRIIAPMLNERIMKTVWQESTEQASDMVDTFLEEENGTTTGTIQGLSRIAFNVLQQVGYGIQEKWNEPVHTVPEGHKLIYSEAIRELVHGFLLIAIIRSSSILKLPIMPKTIKQKGYALDDFVAYTQTMLAKERAAALETDQPRTNLLSLMAQIAEKSANAKLTGATIEDRQTMSDNEIQGNLYQFTLAGFDTTANTLAYSVIMLAIEPKWQNWILEEIQAVAKASAPYASYAEVFPRLQRCLALMHETLRRFSPIAHINRYCPREQVVVSNGRTFHIPADTRITNVFQGIHEQESSWGQDQANFLPTRWIPLQSDNIPSTSSGSGAQLPTLRTAPKGAFIPWSTGPRLCPGMKMAQVEFLAIIYTLFKDYRVEASLLDGETVEQARDRLRSVMLDSSPKLTLQMNKPKDAILTWTRRLQDAESSKTSAVPMPVSKVSRRKATRDLQP